VAKGSYGQISGLPFHFQLGKPHSNSKALAAIEEQHIGRVLEETDGYFSSCAVAGDRPGDAISQDQQIPMEARSEESEGNALETRGNGSNLQPRNARGERVQVSLKG